MEDKENKETENQQTSTGSQDNVQQDVELKNDQEETSTEHASPDEHDPEENAGTARGEEDHAEPENESPKEGGDADPDDKPSESIAEEGMGSGPDTDTSDKQPESDTDDKKPEPGNDVEQDVELKNDQEETSTEHASPDEHDPEENAGTARREEDHAEPENESPNEEGDADPDDKPSEPIANEEVGADSDIAGKAVASDTDKKKESESEEGEHEKDDEEEDHMDEEQKLLESLNFDHATKQDVYKDLKKFSSVENMRVLDKALKEIRPHFDKLYHEEEKAALEAFKAEGNDEADFDYKGDETDQQFFYLYNKLRDKKQAYFSQLSKAKDDNLQKKNNLMERLRELVDGEESTTSLGVLKELQSEWKRIGPVPGHYAKSLWANYNALLDRFYDNRSIYFELKELDRKKNLEAKLELCVRAEDLDNLENIKEAIFQLNELHEEFKHIGPVPKEEQEPLWQRFKAASDKIYAKRKEYFEHLKKDLNENMEKKLALGDKAAEFTFFDSDRITEWNKKTKEILDLQKQWDAIGGLPRERAKEVNKHFW